MADGDKSDNHMHARPAPPKGGNPAAPGEAIRQAHEDSDASDATNVSTNTYIQI